MTAVLLLASTDLRALAHEARRRAVLAVPYALFVAFFFAVVRTAAPHVAEASGGVAGPELAVGLLFHLALAMGVLEGAVGGMRLFVRSDLDTLYALPVPNRDRFLARLLVELAVEAAALSPLVAALVLAVAPASAWLVAPFLFLFWSFHLAVEGTRHLTDLALDRLAPSRSAHLAEAKHLALAAGVALLLAPLVARARGVLVVPALAQAVGALDALWPLPSSAAARATLALFGGDLGGFAAGLGLVLAEAAAAVLACLWLAERGFDLEFLRVRAQSLLRTSSAPWGRGLPLPSGLRTSVLAELVHRDMLVLSRSHPYQMQLVVPFVAFSALLAFNSLHLHLFSRFTQPAVTLYVACFLQLMAVWFLFVPAAEHCFALQERQEWVTRMLPVPASDVVRARFLAVAAYNGSLAMLLSLAIVLSTTGVARPEHTILALLVGLADVAYSAAMAVLVNLASPARLSRSLANPVATVLYVAQYFATLVAFSAASVALIAHVPLLVWATVAGLLAAAWGCLRLSALLIEGRDAAGA